MLIEMKVSSLTVDPFTDMPIVVLRDIEWAKIDPDLDRRLGGPADRDRAGEDRARSSRHTRPPQEHPRQLRRDGRSGRGPRSQEGHVLRDDLPQAAGAAGDHRRRSQRLSDVRWRWRSGRARRSSSPSASRQKRARRPPRRPRAGDAHRRPLAGRRGEAEDVALAPVAAWAIFLFVCSSIPGAKMPKAPIFGHDKLIHTGVYGVLRTLVMFAWRRWPPAVLVVSGYGVTDEIHQLFTHGQAVRRLRLDSRHHGRSSARR